MALTFISACADCGKRIQTRTDQAAAPVCHECRRKRKGLPPGPPRRPRGAPKPRWQPQVVTCPTCGKIFEQQRAGHMYCRKKCRPNHNGKQTPARIAKNRLRRSRIQETWDGVTDQEILDRDRWMCWICKKRIGKSFKWPHPRSASIDHELPLALGGDDTALNKRAAHLRCNTGRRDMRSGGQLPLAFGSPEGGALPSRRPRPLCGICGQEKTGPKCDLHRPVYVRACDHCGELFTARRRRGRQQRYCFGEECSKGRAVEQGRATRQRMTDEQRERKRQRDRERRWVDPDYRARAIASSARAYARNRNDPDYRARAAETGARWAQRQRALKWQAGNGQDSLWAG